MEGEMALLEGVAKALGKQIHDHLAAHPRGELKGIIAAYQRGDELIGFKAFITVRSKDAAVTSPEAECNMFHDLTAEHPGIKFIHFHSHPDGIPGASSGDHTNFKLLYNGTGGYCDTQLLFHRTATRGVTMKTYKVDGAGVHLHRDGLRIVPNARLEEAGLAGTLGAKSESISRIARRHFR